MITSVRSTMTAFIRLDARIGWYGDERLTENLFSDPANGGLQLGSPYVYPIPPHEPYGSFGGLTLPTGLALHTEGRVFLADPDNDLVLYYIPPFGAEARPEEAPDYWPFKPLWSHQESESQDEAGLALEPSKQNPHAEPYRLNQPKDVAFNSAGDLVVADSGNARVLFFTWPGLRVRHILSLPSGKPVAVAFDSDGNGYVADSKASRVWRFDPLWRIDDDYVGGAGDLQQPERLAIDDEDNVFILDRATQKIFMLDQRGRMVLDDQSSPLSSVSELRLFERRFTPPFRLNGNTLEYPQVGRLNCSPLVFTGVDIDKVGRIKGTQLALLARPQRVKLPRRGVFISERLDSGLPECQWHRLILDAELDFSTQLIVQTYASDIALESSRIKQLGDEDWSIPLLFTEGDFTEVLVQSLPGRYLWLQLEFSGDGEHSPLVRAIEIQAPRRSSLQWLPPLFKSDPDSAYFIDRYLSFFDTVFAEVQFEIENFARLLDPYAVPVGDFFEWLGRWFDWHFLAEWPEATRREMIAKAVEFFHQRGTLDGMLRLLQWHTGLKGDQPQIIEHFRVRDYATRRYTQGDDLVNNRLYIGGRALEPGASEIAHWFTVIVPASVVPDKEAKQTLQKLIDAQKPAHTGFQLQVIKQGIRIGCQSTVGVDTWLSDYPTEPLGGMKLGQSSGLASVVERGYRLAALNSNLKTEGNCS